MLVFMMRNVRPDKAFMPHPAIVVGCDANAPYPARKEACNRCLK
ncbi:hypothetical protein ESCAB7627_3217 [Escherichia albertii TW07627]|uniref:Uncharacterized protein n=1 Tax=Escherichia albertii (strain TW07627) TaxID=502347 RepID=A0ABC9NMG2_ESCAT|nr:hypothetical protein [Escherichia albertii]EDS91469.1 hypothetical protein ESCAB7627_3217 [Escherichia albertii TW07627]